MPNKSFSIYDKEGFAVEESDQLIIEIASLHVACLVVKEDKRSIAAFELFTTSEREGEKIDDLFTALLADSKILGNTDNPVNIFVNSEVCLPVPIFKFNKLIADEYLALVFGEGHSSTTHFQLLPLEPGIMNVFRVDNNLHSYLSQHFNKISFYHTYSNFIKTVVNSVDGRMIDQISIHFYNTFFIVVVIKKGVLQLAQTFLYDTPDDVLYYLLNIAKQFDLDADITKIEVSGFIDLEFTLYRQLLTYFKQIVVENIEEAKLLFKVGESPLHYFTPYFNLAR